jgi:nickel/cobalt exporter
MVHALSPGHGKALVAAYLVGSRGTTWHAFLLGIIVTITHIMSIVVLGVASLFAAQYVIPERYMPFISLGAGLLIVFIGIWLIAKWSRGKGEHEHHRVHAHGNRGVSLKELFAFGVTGGIVPCPTGMVVMLTAIAIGRIAFGLLLIVFFSLGLALVLTIIGILAIRAARLLDRFSHTKFLMRWLPLASAIVITVLGAVIVYQGFYVEWTTWR